MFIDGVSETVPSDVSSTPEAGLPVSEVRPGPSMESPPGTAEIKTPVASKVENQDTIALEPKTPEQKPLNKPVNDVPVVNVSETPSVTNSLNRVAESEEDEMMEKYLKRLPETKLGKNS